MNIGNETLYQYHKRCYEEYKAIYEAGGNEWISKEVAYDMMFDHKNMIVEENEEGEE